jgi:hypothetical protein
MSTLLDDEEVCNKIAMDSSRSVDVDYAENPTSLVNTALCLGTAVLGITTTKAIMLRGYHYPARLLLMHLSAALLVELGLRLYRRQFRTNAHNIWIDAGQSVKDTSKTRLVALGFHIVEAVCLSGSLICGYQNILHFKSLPALTMLLAVQLNIIPLSIGSAAWTSFAKGCMGVIGLVSICVFDSHLTRQSGLLSIGAILLADAARVLRIWAGQFDSTCDPGWSTMSTLAIALACALGTVAHSEWQIYTPLYLSDCSPLLAMSIGSGVILLRTNASLFRLYESTPIATMLESMRNSPTVWPMALSGLVTIAAVVAGFDSTMSRWQYAGFALSLLAMHLQTKVSYQDAAVKGSSDCAEPPEKAGPNVVWQKRRKALRCLPTICALLLAFPISIFLTLNLYTDSTTSHTISNGSSDPTKRTFDVVISRFDETSVTVLHQLQPLLQLPSLQQLSSRIIVYDTSPIDPNLFQLLIHDALRNTTSLIIEHRENVGREAGAYIHHMSTRYQDLADHTLFVQAEAHSFAQALRRIDDYFVPKTGFLPLSDMQQFCNDCEKCWDHSTWSESSEVLDMVVGEACRPFPMTYRGQFIVSRQRIQARERSHYERLLEQLSDPKSWIHGSSYTEQPWMPGKVDSVDSPRLGYTLERTWAAMMGCWDRKLVDRCPSMPAGWIRGELGSKPEDVAACQCLDEG